MHVFQIVLLNVVVSTWCACDFRIDASELLQLLQLRVFVVGDTQNFLLNRLLFLFHEQQIFFVIVTRKRFGHVWSQKMMHLARVFVETVSALNHF